MPSKKNAQRKLKKKNKAKPNTLLDNRGYDYARLLRDPCNGPLVHGVGGAARGSYITRFVSEYTAGVAAGETAGYAVFTPGGISSDGTTGYGAVLGPTSPCLTSSTASATYFEKTSQPGYAFLNNNSRAVRCLAACMQVYYVGAESARSGWLAYGHAPAGSFASPSISPDSVRALLPNAGRVPEGVIELRWVPGSADEDTVMVSVSNTSMTDWAQKESIVCAFGGLPAGVGLRIRLTAVYEWEPAVNAGTATAGSATSASSSTLSHVLSFLHAKDPHWWVTQAANILSYL